MSSSIQGGLIFMTKEKCPWKFNYDKTEVFFFDHRTPTTWNPRGTGWRLDDSVRIHCQPQQQRRLAAEGGGCGCRVLELRLSAEGAAAAAGHKDKEGG